MLQVGAALRRAKTCVLLDDKHMVRNSPQAAQFRSAKRTAVGKQFRRSNATSQRREVKKIPIQRCRRKLEKNLPFFIVPIVRNESILSGQPGHSIFEWRGRGSALGHCKNI